MGFSNGGETRRCLKDEEKKSKKNYTYIYHYGRKVKLIL